MPGSVQPPHCALHRFVAGAASVMVMLLTLAAASPTWHAWLHRHATDTHEHNGPAHEVPRDAEDWGCAVTLLAGGILPLQPDIVVIGSPPRSLDCPDVGSELFLLCVHYRHLPSHAPPSV